MLLGIAVDERKSSHHEEDVCHCHIKYFPLKEKMHQNQILVTLTTKNMGHSADYTKIIFEMDKSFSSYNTEFQQLLMVGETFTLYRHPIVTIIVK